MAKVLSPNANRTVSEAAHLMARPVVSKDNTDGKHPSPTGCNGPSSSNTPPPPTPLPLDYRKEVDRLKTLQKWPIKFLSVESVAKNGFYYAGRGDAIKCHFCKVELSHWSEGDDVEADHGRWSPQCPFLLKKPTNNIPMSRDECGLMDSGLFKPAHSLYMTEPSRLASFRCWPERMRQTPRELAEAGFYYSGVGDQTICYYCGGGLKDWEEEDNPWEQHALWFERCPYVINLKGVDFIKKTKKKYSEPLPSPCPQNPPSVLSVSVQQNDVTSQQIQPAPDSSASADNKMCQICFENERNVCFVPCGHVVTCIKCAMSLTVCPVCRQPYTKLVKLFFS